MIKEDYISFENAKLLKEKGFVGESEIGDRCGFYEQNKEYPNQINLVYDDLNNSELEWNECLRFTHQMAMKWLREVHRIEIHIALSELNADNSRKYMFDIFSSDINRGFDSIQEYGFNSYEETCEAAIKYCLENLI